MRAKSRALLLPVLALCALAGYAPNSIGQAGGTLAYVPPAGRVGGLDGFVRVVNRSTTPATVEITGYDDTGARYGPVTLAMPASSSVRLLSEHLERGSAVDGLPVGLGNGTGDWRLELRSASDVEAVALVRTPDKFMTSLQAVVEPESEGATVYPVEVFNPGSNTAKASVLRLVNPGAAAAAVTIGGIDDRGAGAPGGDVRLTVPAGGAVRVTARELESGEAHLRGRLGDGAGKWRLRVSSDRALFVMNLLRSQTDSGVVYVSNLSVGEVRAAPLSSPPPSGAFRDCEGCPLMVRVPSGSYRMGSPELEQWSSSFERPVHRVTFARPFAVGVYEVTFDEWDACVSDGGCGGYRPDDSGWGRGRRPVRGVSWSDAKAFVRWLSSQTGAEYRLLSESEWEYVARAGTTTPFHTGATITPAQANYNGRYSYPSDVYNPDGLSRGQTVPVGSFAPNAFGLYDVHGNVYEWVEDCWNISYVGAPRDGSAWMSGNCDARPLRGGSWNVGPRYHRSASRDWRRSTGDRGAIFGFRVARTLTP